MKTNFFENIANLNVPGIWKIGIHTDENGRFVVSVLFTAHQSGDNATKSITPLLFKGTAKEIDEGFFEALENPIQETAGFYANTEAYLKSLEQARLASKMEQDKKAKNGKSKTDTTNKEGIEVPKVDLEEKRKAYTEIVRQIVELDTKMMYEEALEILPDVTIYPDREAEITKRKADLERKRELKKQLLF